MRPLLNHPLKVERWPLAVVPLRRSPWGKPTEGIWCSDMELGTV